MASHPDFDLLQKTPLLIIISGPAGAGKDSVVRKMQERGLPFHFVVTATTRPMRPDEVDGQDYFFVSEEEFARMVAANELLEHREVYEQNKGIPRAQVQQALASGKDVVMRLDVEGAQTVHRLASEALMIFVTVRNVVELEQRLRERNTDTARQVALRMDTARQEMEHIKDFDYVVFNDRLEDAIDTVEAIIKAEHHRVSPRRVQL
jgi:guanylate kinase